MPFDLPLSPVTRVWAGRPTEAHLAQRFFRLCRRVYTDTVAVYADAPAKPIATTGPREPERVSEDARTGPLRCPLD